MNKYKTPLIICLIFSITMAYLESAIVVYLREIFYPDGFNFPIEKITLFIYWVEIGREVATILMLWAIAKLIAKNNREWFAFFSFNFAVWDIWYYIWLKIFLDWPQSLFTWDILFLIPIPWVAPVLAPVLVSISLIAAALIILSLEEKSKPLAFSKIDWWLEGLAGYVQAKISNGILEGINSKIQLAKSRARGYRNAQNLINMAYFIAGKLKFDYQHYST